MIQYKSSSFLKKAAPKTFGTVGVGGASAHSTKSFCGAFYKKRLLFL